MSAAVITPSTNTPAVVAASATLNRTVGGSVDLVKIGLDGIPGLPAIPDNFYLSTGPAPDIEMPTFNSVEALNAASMRVGVAGGTRTISLPLSPSPEPPAPKFANHAAL